ncbi:hypothetical protein A4D02_34260 [Niastella koreensis]|uniref:Acyl carrier protein n=2 Tax=Niastella koreensis TaxID=354356 RepID=G8TDE0_NIAKG|nr:DUF1493 family protein [Niastella koreensis]AEV99380.1 protein of unknown function DUF1493 [Niastella koreensis GR20-10]OQP45234.1 hypothetical protein A4D02_34260 [Niastella koreensis]
MDEIFDRIIKFVVANRWDYDFPLTRNTSLQKDLKIYGDDAAEIIIAFGKEFNVDISDFKLQEYFEPEGDAVIASIMRLFKKKKMSYKPLTLGDLEYAVIKGKLE